MTPTAGSNRRNILEERIERPSIDGLLDRAVKRRICVVIGAAGWGKTTAVAIWSRDRSTAWLRYEDYGGNEQRLLAGLVKVLRTHVSVPDAPSESLAAVDTDQVKSSIAKICSWLDSRLDEDAILVLDDLQELRPDGDAARAIECLSKLAPDRLHMVLISRCELPFSLQRLRGRGLVTELHAPDLAFDIADTETLLHKTVGEDPPGLSIHVWEQSGGWPAAVHSAIEMLWRVIPEKRFATVRRLCHPGERFHDYLAEEVIGAGPEWIQQLLRRLAIFGEARSTAEISRGLTDPTTVLAELSRQGLVRRTGESAGWAVVRPLRDYFEHETAPSSSERKALHVTAANECIRRGTPADALRHLLAAGDHAACAALLVDHGDAIVESGQSNAVLQAAELPAVYRDDPRIQRVLGQAHQVRGQWAQALEHFQRAGHDRGDLEPALSWRVGLINFAQGEFSRVLALAQRTRLDRADSLDEIRVLALTASAHRMSGDLLNLQKKALQTRAAARRCGGPRAWSHAHHVFALIAAAEGDWRQADTHCTDALRCAEASEDVLQLAWTRAFRAFHQFEAGAPQHALTDAEIALSLSEQCENPFYIAHALTTRGRAHSRLGMLQAAADDFATSVDLFQRIGSRFLAWPLCGLGDLHRTRGQLARARAAYEEALTLAEPYHDVFGLSSALIGLARIEAADDLPIARQYAARAVALGEGLRKVPALLARGWVELIGGDRQRASTDAHRAAAAARQRRDNPGLAEAITLSALACDDSAVDAIPLRDAIDIWQETGCRLEGAAARLVAARLDAPIPDLDAHLANQMLRDHGVDVESRRAAGPLGVLVRSAPAVFIQTLGVFRVIRDGITVPITEWKSKKARDLLKILVAKRRPVPREQLMELLWPEKDPALASNRLSVLLSMIRDVLRLPPAGEDPLVTTDGMVLLNYTKIRVDVEDFLAQAAAALDADRAKKPDATARLAAAVNTHTGDFLVDDAYEEWVIELAEEVRATHIALLWALVTRMREAGDTDAVVRHALRLLQQDRYDEQAHLTLVEVLLDAGRLGQARRHYKTYVHRMAEIEVPPRALPNMTSTISVMQLADASEVDRPRDHGKARWYS